MPNPGAGDAELEAEIDRLYQGPLDRFTADRNQLAATLKKAGAGSAAERVRALVKPSATAWAVNQAWWQHRARFQTVLDAGGAQRRAHVAFAEGRKADVRAAAEARQAAVRDLTEAALDALGGRKAVAPDAQYRISGTVEALASSGVPAGETAGRFTRDLQSSGLDALSALAEAAGAVPRPTIVARGTPPPGRPAPADPPVRPTAVPAAERGESLRARQLREAEEAAARSRAAAVAQARTRVEQFTSALDEATRTADAAAAEEAAARTALDALTQRRTDLEASLDQARAEEAAARRALSSAAAAASRAGLDRGRAARDAERARDALERAERGH
jgi:hypothetical protein